MAIKKSAIYGDLWRSCDELRGGMDASQYKDYILVILFIKYVSDKYGKQNNSPIIISKGSRFDDMVLLKGKSDIGEGINKIIAKLAEENGLKGIIDVADFNDSDKLGSGKAKVDKLTNIIGLFQTNPLDFSKNRADGDDILGDAYEFLMQHFATESGKSKGQFYTPSEVSQIMAKVIGAQNIKKKNNTVYDPTAGSGSLLLKVSDETPNGITIYGQENDVATRAMAIMNMWIHNMPDAEITRENTIANPLFKNKDGTLKTFDLVVSNPPFSYKSWSNGIDPSNDEFERFDGFGIPPSKNGDYAFLLHVIKSLKSTGKGAIILPHGVLFRGNAELEIRKEIINRGYIKGVIGLPPNLFFGTSIPACIIILDKEHAKLRKEIFLINANEGFIKEGNKNRLRARDIHKIVDVFDKQLEIPGYSKLVPYSDISNDENNHNLNFSRYIDSFEVDDIEDIDAHLNGGIPSVDIDALNSYWQVYPSLRKLLFTSNGRPNYEKLNVDKSKIKEVIFTHIEFKNFLDKIKKIYSSWEKSNSKILNDIKIDVDPKKIIHAISEDILVKFSKIELIDEYDIYQYLMNYWNEPMEDDVFIVSQHGWNVKITDAKNQKRKAEDWNSELVPKNIIIDKYFTKQKDELKGLEDTMEKVTHQMQTLEEENEGDEDLLSEAKTDSGKITKIELIKRIQEIKNNPGCDDELTVLKNYQKLLIKEVDLKKQIKTIECNLGKDLRIKYEKLTELEIKEFVIKDKWLKSIKDLIDGEMERISQKLATRIIDLNERYEIPMSVILKDFQTLEKKVNNDLKEIGFKW